jgi:hypothetical protein
MSRTLLLFLLALATPAPAANNDHGGAIDPNGLRLAADGDVHGTIDPNGGTVPAGSSDEGEAGGAIDPNGLA